MDKLTYLKGCAEAHLEAGEGGTIDLGVAVSPQGGARCACLNGLVLEVLPATPTWGPFAVKDGKFAHAAGWLGWLLVEHAPWIYSYKADKWMYIDAANISSSGGWVYIPR